MSKLRLAPLWLFDLDNTLHDASHAIFPEINRNMNAYITDLVGDAAHAAVLRHQYFLRYGATLSGLVRHHQVKPAEFLHAAHHIENLTRLIRAERGLVRLLRALPGQKILLTNAPQAYAYRVLAHLRLHRHFAQRISVESMRVHGQLCPKPSRKYLRRLLARQRVPAQRCILVEDSLENCRAARVLGMKTVLIDGYTRTSIRPASWLDARLCSVRKMLRSKALYS